MSPIPPEYQQVNECLAEAPPFVIFGHDRRRVYLAGADIPTLFGREPTQRQRERYNSCHWEPLKTDVSVLPVPMPSSLESLHRLFSTVRSDEQLRNKP
jgi:hypothetical protein